MLGTATQADRRRDLLDPLVKELTEFVAARHGCTPTEVVVAGQQVALDPWERLMLQRALDPEEVGRAPWLARVLQVIVYRVRYKESYAQADAGQPLGARAEREAVTFTAVGMALLEELQRDVHGRVRRGELDNAKRLTAFRNRLQTEVDHLCKALGAERTSEAHSCAAEMIEPAVEQTPATLHIPDESEPAQAPRRRPRPQAQKAEEPVNRLKPLLIVLAAATIAWIGMLLVRGGDARPLPQLDLRSFSGMPALVEVQARPPSLFATVDAELWRGMSRESRAETIERMASIVEAAGYVGISVRTPDGTVVADWVPRRGPRLIEARKRT